MKQVGIIMGYPQPSLSEVNYFILGKENVDNIELTSFIWDSEYGDLLWFGWLT